MTSYFACDHIENLLQDVEGQLPDAKEELLGIIDRYLLMPPEERTNFRLGRRAGYYNTLDDMNDPLRHERIEQMLKDISTNNEDIENVIFNLKRRFLV